MLHLGIRSRAQVALRKVVRLDLPRLVRIEEQTAVGHWTREDFQTALRTKGTIAGQAEDRNLIHVVRGENLNC
jgi:hypothetical protein